MSYLKPLYITILSTLCACYIFGVGDDSQFEQSIEWHDIGDSMSLDKYIIHTKQDANYLLIQYGMADKIIELQDNKAHLDMTKFPAAGVIKFYLLDASKNIIGTKSSYVLSGEENHFLTTWQSYPFLRANDKDISQLIALPTDIYGNMLDEMPEVELNFSTAKTLAIRQKTKGEAFISFKMNTAQKVNKIPLFLATAKGNSRPIQILIESGDAQRAQLEYKIAENKSNGQEVIQYIISGIEDKHGNEINDGQEVLIQCTLDGNPNQITAVSLNGKAVTELVVPEGTRSVSARVYNGKNAISNSTNINFVIPTLEYEIKIVGDDLVFSKLRDQNDQPLLNGIKATLYLESSNKNYKIITESDKSELRFDLNDNHIDAGYYTYSLDILGKKYKGEVKI